MDKDKFLDYFLNVPVSVNNLYGDPFHPVQTENTFEKLKKLEASGHKGIVSIITKSEITPEQAEQLSNLKLNLVVLVSISGLKTRPEGNAPFENTKGSRYVALRNCANAGLKTLAYIRPFIPPYNTFPEVIEGIFKGIHEAGISNAVVSGLRGDEEILLKSGIKKEKIKEWNYRVKIIPKEIRGMLDTYSRKYNIRLFERTSCGVSYITGKDYSYNPYYSAPQLAKCYNCPIKTSCFDCRDSFVPTDEDLEFVRMLGYRAEIVRPNKNEMCSVLPEKRTQCVSCCTSCYKLNRPGIRLISSGIRLADTSLLRLLTGKLVFSENLYDDGKADVARPTLEVFKPHNLYILNSWWSYSREIRQCYGCSYCIVKHFKNEAVEYGDIPSLVGNKIWKENEK